MSISCVRDQLGLELDKNEIDIVHRIGRVLEGKTRPILIKFVSHKTKERIMRKKKEAKDVRFVEDLAYGIKKMYSFLNANPSELNLEFVWTIDGKIKYKFFNHYRRIEIRNYSDYHRLVNKLP